MRLKGSILIILVLVASIFMSGTAMAYTLTTTGSNTNATLYGYNGYGPYQTGQGGEFTLQPGDGLEPLLNNYSLLAKIYIGGNYALQSFCLEYPEHIWGNTINSVVLSNAAVYGGGGAAGGSDSLSKGAAWLYYYFSQGTLGSYDYNTEAGRHNSASALQNTIWWLEGEVSDPGDGNTFRHQVMEKFGTEYNAKDNNFNGLTREYPVMVATLWEQGFAGVSGHERQDMLVTTGTVPVPPAIYLLGAGLMGVGVIRKRVNKI
ncbi:MAG: hypothetical protein NT010_13765 [Proteobacteria bacterium]|nr:hypothetical protein [Pseudomonadota bacterium]